MRDLGANADFELSVSLDPRATKCVFVCARFTRFCGLWRCRPEAGVRLHGDEGVPISKQSRVNERSVDIDD
jgi:hypothetical protein